MRIAITGGAGFVGSQLVPYLLQYDHHVTVLDTFWFGDKLPQHKNLISLRGDIRDPIFLKAAFQGAEAVIHLACISNDPSFELDPLLGASVNGVGTFRKILAAVHECGIEKFVYASSSSVYGISRINEVVEDSPINPLTDYSKYKWECEQELRNQTKLDWTILRPATVCGWSPKLRLDVVVNAMTASILRTGVVQVHGGYQMRANLHIEDMCEAYHIALTDQRATQQTYNVGFENLSLNEIAIRVVGTLGFGTINKQISMDERSYRICSRKIATDLNWAPRFRVDEAIRDIRAHLWHGEHTVNLTRMKQLEGQT